MFYKLPSAAWLGAYVFPFISSRFTFELTFTLFLVFFFFLLTLKIHFLLCSTIWTYVCLFYLSPVCVCLHVGSGATLSQSHQIFWNRRCKHLRVTGSECQELNSEVSARGLYALNTSAVFPYPYFIKLVLKY